VLSNQPVSFSVSRLRSAVSLDRLQRPVSGRSFSGHFLQRTKYGGQRPTRQGAEPVYQPLSIHGSQLVQTGSQERFFSVFSGS
jgi:hypothetical protein